jgi:predicted NAD/FAD-binding protein
LWEKASVPGGVATSHTLNDQGLFINDGVQGGAPSYRNTLLLHKENGFEPSKVHMKISFGKNETAWNNHGKEFETELVRRLRPEIARFGRVLKWIKRFEFVFVFVPIAKLMRLLRFSDDFCNLMVFPLTALFFGTGNQTPHVSSAIIARVFLDPDLKLFDYDPAFLLSQTPEMFAFPNLQLIYNTIVKNSGTKVFYERFAVEIKRETNKVTIKDNTNQTIEFDEVVLACDAETSLKLLGEQASFMEKKVLGNVKYFNDVTITHEDYDYMNRYYDIDLKSRNDQYFVRIDPNEPSRIEMSFNLSNYQPQLIQSNRAIFQTIFLDDKRSNTWTINEIKKEKILLEKWWHQMAHTWKHFAFTVPFVRFIQGKRRTWFCGSYTLFNTHEMAVISGLAVAVRLGAKYPFESDELASKQFDQYLKFSHGFKRS